MNYWQLTIYCIFRVYGNNTNTAKGSDLPAWSNTFLCRFVLICIILIFHIVPDQTFCCCIAVNIFKFQRYQLYFLKSNNKFAPLLWVELWLKSYSLCSRDYCNYNTCFARIKPNNNSDTRCARGIIPIMQLRAVA